MMKQIFLFTALLAATSLAALAAENAWFEGGTLQKATIDEWQTGTAENQLATAADFIASLSSISDVGAVSEKERAGIKKRAEDLRACVNETVENPDVDRSRAVAELVVLCTILRQK